MWVGHEEKTCFFLALAKKANGKGSYVRLYGNWVRADLYSWLWWPEKRKIAPPVEPQPSREDIAQRIARGDRSNSVTTEEKNLPADKAHNLTHNTPAPPQIV